MVDVIKVTLWGEDVGALSWDSQRHFASFEYFPSFRSKNWDVSPIHMPVRGITPRIFSFPALNQDTYRGLPGMLSDVLPDDFGNKLIDQWLDLNGIPRASFTPLDRLCYIGTRGMGALEFQPARHPASGGKPIDAIDKLAALAQRILNTRETLRLSMEETASLNELVKVGTSAGGQRAKAVIAYNSTTGEIRSGQAGAPDGFEHYIFKFDGAVSETLGDPAGYGRIEYAYFKMATSCGIEMMDSMLFEENGRAHFMTKRFDRVGTNEKVHMQTLCALAHFDYRTPGVYSYENAFEVMRLLGLPHAQAVQLYRRMVFNVIARNQDDHTKNISFLMDKNGTWKLAPAYDMTYAHNPQGIWTSQHQMSLNGKRDDFSLDDLLEVGEGISFKKSRECIAEVREAVSNWAQYAREAGVPDEQAKKIHKAFRLNL